MTWAAAWRIAGARAVGTAHVERAESCQDAFAWLGLEARDGESGVAVVAADGAGSAAHAERGAELVCRHFLEWIEREIDRAGSLDALGPSSVSGFLSWYHERLDEIGRAEAIERRDFASTLVAAVLTPDATYFLQVGDGAIVARRGSNDGFELAFWPEEIEYASVTTFVTDDRAHAAARFSTWNTGAAEVALFSDGLQRLVLNYADRSVYDRFFLKMFGYLGSEPAGYSAHVSAMLEQYLASPELDRRTDDDKTLVLVQRAGVRST